VASGLAGPPGPDERDVSRAANRSIGGAVDEAGDVAPAAAVISAMAGAATGEPRMSAWSCISSSFLVMPPSARSSPRRSSPVSASIASTRSRV